MVEFAMSDLEADSMMVECDPRQGEHVASCLMYSGDGAPKDVNAGVATLKTKRTIHCVNWSRGFQVPNQSPVSRGDARRESREGDASRVHDQQLVSDSRSRKWAESCGRL